MLAGSVAGAGCELRQVKTARLTPLFGPALGKETISGHVADERRVWLMAGGSHLVRIDLDARSQDTVALQLPPHEECWGLARLADGSLWSLMGWNTVVQLRDDGGISRSVDLAVAHLGLFGVGDRFVFQQASLPAGTPALFSGRPDDPVRLPWSDLRARPFDALATGAAAALNLVACGVSQTAEMPCWFPDEPVVFLIAPNGKTRRLELPGLPHVAPELLINAKAPPRPVRDVFVERDGTLWVISTGSPPDQFRNVPGGWLLARYGSHGEAIDRRVLPESARLILNATHGRALLLTGAGMIAEVRP